MDVDDAPPLERGMLLIVSERNARGGWDRQPRLRHSRKVFVLLLLDDDFAIFPLEFAVLTSTPFRSGPKRLRLDGDVAEWALVP